jgi:steroid 5-alpha reductase family enzyme
MSSCSTPQDAIFLAWQWQAVFLAVLMAIVTLVANRLKNAGIVDVVWAGGFTVLAGIAVWLTEGYWLRQLVFAGMVSLASIRLAGHLWRRFRKEFPQEDGRYHALRQLWEAQWKRQILVDLGFAGVMYLQGLLMWILALPFAWVAQNPVQSDFSAGLSLVEWIAVGVWLIGFIGEAVADEQLRQFKARPENQGLPCQSGLWRFSRHPNYFSEWLMWLGYWLFACGTPGGWLFFHSPLLMLYLLTRVSGVAATEDHILKTKGDAYRRYQQSTSAFFPWFPKPLPKL